MTDAGLVIDRAFLEKLERLAIRWRKSFPGLVGGHNPSRLAGPGQEFLDHRHFHHGDDLRAVNWRAYMRLEKLFLKMFQVEPRVPVRLLLDCSLSMQAETAGDNPSKFDYARKLAAALCYIGLVRLDTITIQPFAASLAESFICSGGRHRFAPAADFLSNLAPAGRTVFFEIARQFLAKYPQRGLLVIISDFLDDQDCQKPLQYLADFGHELLLVHLWDEQDRSPVWEGQLDLLDAESGQKLEMTFDGAARQAYTAAFDEYAEAIQHIGIRTGGRYVGLPTTVPLEDAIFGPLVHQGSLT